MRYWCFIYEKTFKGCKRGDIPYRLAVDLKEMVELPISPKVHVGPTMSALERFKAQ